MIPDSPTDPRQALEVSITAMLLGELPEEQAAFLRQAIAADPELARMHERLKLTIGLMRETAATPVPAAEAQSAPLRLSESKREQLLQRFKTIEPAEFKRSRHPRLVLELAVAACFVVILVSMFMPALSRSKSRGYSSSSLRRMYELGRGGEGGEKDVPPASPQVATPLPQAQTPALAVKSPEPASTPSRTTIVLPPGQEYAWYDATAAANTKDALGAFPPQKRAGTTLSASTHNTDQFGTWSLNSPTPSTERYGHAMGPNTADKQAILQLQTEFQPQPPPVVAMNGTVAGKATAGDSLLTFGGPTVSPAPATPPAQAPSAIADAGMVARSDIAAREPVATVVITNAPALAFSEPAPAFKGVPTDIFDATAPRSRFYRLAGTAAEPAEATKKTEVAANAISTDPRTGLPAGIVAPLDPNTGLPINPTVSAGAMVYNVAPITNSVVDGIGQSTITSPIGGVGGGFGGGALAISGQPPAAATPSAPPSDLSKNLLSDQAADLNKVPALGEVPVAGRMFRARSNIALPQTDTGSAAASNVYNLGVIGYRDSAAKDEMKVQELASAEKQVEQLQRQRTLTLAQLAEEKDFDLPQSATTEPVDRATPARAASAGVGEKIRSALGGEVRRSARVNLQREQADTRGGVSTNSFAAYDPFFAQSEFEAIQSEPVLGKVVDDLHLDDEFGRQKGTKVSKEQAIAKLKQQLELKLERGTNVVDISARAKTPEEAAKLANAVTDSYLKYRDEQRKQLAEGDVERLNKRLKSQSSAIREAESNVGRLRLAMKTPDKPADSAPTPTMSGDTLRKLAALRIESAARATNSPAGTDEPLNRASSQPIPEPQPEIQTRNNAFSTFSMNVSDVSFKLAAASLEKGVLPDPASIRTEEFINAFDYRDPEPAAGAPIAFAWERSGYPFAQGRDLLRFSLKTAAQGRQPGRPLNLVLLLDNSGSMERADRVQIIHEALRVLATQLSGQDIFSVVTFARTPRLWVDGRPGSEAGKVADEVGGLTPQGGTNLGDAMDLAYATARRHYIPNGINRVVLLTDGAANLGDVEPDSLKKKVEANRQQGIALDCFGIGWEGYNDDLLETLTRNADGRYGFLNTPEEAATGFAGQLAGALRVAASDVKVQVEFNPNRVTAYRQLGYAKLQLTKEQFRDNTVNAAQIGAAESGNALYVIEVNGAGDGPLATVRVRYRVPGTAEYHEQEWTVPYTGSAGALQQSSPALRLAATASAFSEWLAASPYAGEVTPDRLLSGLSGVPEIYGADARPKKLEWMIRQAKSLAGK